MKTKHYFRFLWTAFLVSSIGDWLQKIAIPIIIFEKTGSAYQMAGLYGVSFIPWVLFTMFGGVLADRMKKSKIIAYGYLLSLIFSLFLIIEIQQPHLNMWFIYVATFLLSSIEPLTHPSFQSLIPQLSSEENLERDNALIGGVDNTLTLIGPLIGGSLILIISPYLLLWVNAFSFLISGLIALFIKEQPILKANEKINIWKEMWLGIEDSRKNKVVWNGAILFFFIQFGTSLFQANLAYFATGILHGNSFDYSLFLSGTGLGALIGVSLASKIAKRFRESAGKLIVFCAIGSGLSLELISLLNLHNFLLISLALGLSALFDSIIVITYFSLRQRVVAPEILGRVVSVTRTISYVSIPLGAFVGGVLINHQVSIYLIIALAAALEIISAVWSSFTPLVKQSKASN